MNYHKKVPIRCLCQNCLRVVQYTDRRHVGEDLCICGGEFCGCSDCNNTIILLEHGFRDADDLGLQTEIGDWNPITGIEQ